MSTLYFEDLENGAERDLGTYTVPRSEMVEFARQYDPQPIHVDEAVAEETIYDGLIASGWYTAGVCMRLLVDGFLNETASIGSFGLEELRWRTPVRAGDTIHAYHRIAEKTPSSSRDDRGYIENEVRAENDDGEEVVFWQATNIFARKPSDG
ncbi:MaoC family dehydratase [Halopenitus sp. POP-27]|uniref:MaoC family dehydratase n=1 Tax=Halopenitus sp. POP-27 TaxID=2994425 RepID=UPI0024685461|nr:MaoC family dehydratase [Halopenitus sp. POP-27]